MSAPLLGRPETAMLLAIERANGGELAGLEQVLAAFETLFDRRMEPQAYERSCALLCEAGLVEYADECLGLTPEGRRLLRRTGIPGSPERPHRLAEQLSLLEELDLAAPGSVTSPDAGAFEAAANDLGSDAAMGEEPVLGVELAPQAAGTLTPSGWIHPRSVPRLTSRVLPPHAPLPDVPLVQPHGGDGADRDDTDSTGG